MPANVYEGLFIFDSGRYARDSGGVPAEVDETIKKLGGEVLVSRLWDERRLAYPIDGHRKGTYWLTYFKLDSMKLTQLNRDYQLNDNVLRCLFVRVDPRLVDALVEHAKTGTPTEVRAAAEAEARASAEKRAAVTVGAEASEEVGEQSDESDDDDNS